jgi:hypothetical protein
MEDSIAKTVQLLKKNDGTKHWYLYGKLHREDGPAVEKSNGSNF